MSSSAALLLAAQAEARARRAETRIEDGRPRDASLALTINAVELYLKALELADNVSERKKIDGKCKELLSRAENIKETRQQAGARQDVHSSSTPSPSRSRPPASTRDLSTREKIILLEGGKLNGLIFKAWEGLPKSEEFVLKDGDELFSDAAVLPLSELQLESFAGWMRPQEALAAYVGVDGKTDTAIPTMIEGNMKTDFVQDMTSDCSVVASLCAISVRAEQGHEKLLRTTVFPYDHNRKTPAISLNGKYVFRLHFNGCWRRVEIDDRLPVSSNTRVLHVIDRSTPGLLWPILLEKAYLKVRGGYDFPGSNSGTDLAVITGWIPQQVFLHDDDVDQDDLWKTIYNGFKDGDLLLTIGTGRLLKLERKLLGLASEHNYAVLSLKQSGSVGEMLIKNPWSNGDVWRGAARRRPHPNQEAGSSISPIALEHGNSGTSDEMTPGTFWMDFRSVFQHFDDIYLNWNPSLFSHRQDLHFSWLLTEISRLETLFVNHPQFAVSSKKGGEVWLLLNRHFRTGDHFAASPGRNGYISLYLHRNNGEKVLSYDGAMVQGPFVDSPNTLLKFNLPANSTYTAVVASQWLPTGKHNFSLSAFSHDEVYLKDARCPLDHVHSVTAAWTSFTAGGNSQSTRYLQNPQFKIKVNMSTNVALILQLNSGDKSVEVEAGIHIKLLVAFTTGGRITRLRPRDVVSSSGGYRPGSAVVQTRLEKGSYAVICSTFESGQYAPFQLDLLSPASQALQISPLPAEFSGRHSILSSPAMFSATMNRLLAPLMIPRISRSIFILRPTSVSTAKSASLFKMILEQGQGPYKEIIASSTVDEEEYSSVSADIRIEETRLLPEMGHPNAGGLWLVVERMAQVSSTTSLEEAVQVEILADERIELGSWGTGDG